MMLFPQKRQQRAPHRAVGGIALSMDSKVGDFEKADVLIETRSRQSSRISRRRQ
jgi:hypothetical protein